MKKFQRMELRNAYILLVVMMACFLFAEPINAQKSNLLFMRCADNTVLLSGYNTNNVVDSVLYVPTYVRLGVEVLQVKGIADDAFQNRNYLQRVTYSNDILVINDSNFIDSKDSGTYDNPYTIAGAQANQSGKGYVKGYIVGYIPGQKLADAVFGTDGASASNIIIATSADETDVSKCLPIQLVSGSAVRTGINLANNPGMYKKELLIYGSLEKYFGAAGLKSTTYAECDGKTFGTKPGDDPKPVGDGYYMDFKTTGSKGDWTIEDKTLPEGLTYVWNFDSTYGMVAEAYTTKCLAAESWLVSPLIELSTGVKTLTVHQALNFLNGNNRADYVNIMVSSDKTNWTEVNMTSWPAGTDWTFGDYTADFSTYAGKTIYLAFKYTSTESCAPTWEIEKLSISNDNQNLKAKSFDYNAANSPSFEIGNNAFLSCTNLTRIDLIPNTTTIGANAFFGCKSLTSITIPNSVESIGYRAFSGCSGLTSIVVESGNKYYDSRENCNAIIETSTNTLLAGCKNTIIPNSVTSIGNYAFEGCSGLTSVTIGNSVTSIGDDAFRNCSGLTDVTLNSDSIVNKTYESNSNISDIFGIQVQKYTIGDGVIGIGSYAFYGCSELKELTIGNSVTSIGIYAFSNCSGLTSVTIPNSVTSIGGSAFSGCTSLPVENNLRYADTYLIEAVDKTLSTYIIKEGTKWIGSYAFAGCTGLTSVTIPNSVTSIGSYAFGSYAFAGCTGLTSITIPNSVTSIGSYAFYGCSGLTSVTIGNSVTSIGYYAFDGCSGLTSVNITDIDKWAKIEFGGPIANPLYYAKKLYLNGELVTDAKLTSATKIGSYAFYQCYGLTSVTIGNSVTSIGTDAFYQCSGLTSVTIGNSVTSIGSYAFYGCSGLTDVTIGNSVTSIGERAFYECKKLSNIKMGNAVESIGGYAFYGCSDLESIVLPEVLKEIGYYAFANTCLTSIDIPNSVTDVGSGAFENCKVLSSVKIGKSVERIRQYAFNGCLCIDSIDIPNGVIAIEYNAFYGCQSLKKVKIPSSVQEIAPGAFRKCPNLEDVYVCWNKPITIDSYVFDKTNGYILSTLWVPIGRINFYKVADHWGKFVEIKEWDASTGIEKIEINATDEASPISSPEGKDLYNLQGQKVSVNGFSSVVIKNGKKYLKR